MVMKALVYLGNSEHIRAKEPEPKIQNSTRAMIRMTKTIVCEVDIHITDRDVPEVMENLVLGQEGVVTTNEVETGVEILNVGNKSLTSYTVLRNL
jgi:alcohol dehydrogenase